MKKTTSSNNVSTAKERFYTLRKKYLKWKDGFFGSRKVYERLLKNYLYSLYKKEIITEHDYIIVRKGGVRGDSLSTTLYVTSWLEIEGPFDPKSYNKLIKKYPRIMGKWWRAPVFLSVRGKIKKWKLSHNKINDTVILYLNKVYISE